MGAHVGLPESKAALAQAYARGDKPKFIRVIDTGDELWGMGGSAFVLPTIPANAPAALEYALRLRREAIFSGECDDCGAAFDADELIRDSPIPTVTAYIHHRANCPAADENVGPQLASFREEAAKVPLERAFKKASADTKEKTDAAVGENVTRIDNAPFNEWAESLLDSLLLDDLSNACDHLKRNPAQTWSMLLGSGKWYCDQCWAYLGDRIVSEGYNLGVIEEHTCDRCRRYSPNLQPLVIRISNFVLRGGMCRRCARDSQSANEKEA